MQWVALPQGHLGEVELRARNQIRPANFLCQFDAGSIQLNGAGIVTFIAYTFTLLRQYGGEGCLVARFFSQVPGFGKVGRGVFKAAAKNAFVAEQSQGDGHNPPVTGLAGQRQYVMHLGYQVGKARLETGEDKENTGAQSWRNWAARIVAECDEARQPALCLIDRAPIPIRFEQAGQAPGLLAIVSKQVGQRRL